MNPFDHTDKRFYSSSIWFLFLSWFSTLFFFPLSALVQVWSFPYISETYTKSKNLLLLSFRQCLFLMCYRVKESTSFICRQHTAFISTFLRRSFGSLSLSPVGGILFVWCCYCCFGWRAAISITTLFFAKKALMRCYIPTNIIQYWLLLLFIQRCEMGLH